MNFTKFLRTLFFTEHLWTTASEEFSFFHVICIVKFHEKNARKKRCIMINKKLSPNFASNIKRINSFLFSLFFMIISGPVEAN